MFHRLGGSEDHDHVADLEYGIWPGLPPDDAVAPHRAHGGLGTPIRQLRDALSHRPSMRRQDYAVKFLTKCVTVIQRFRPGGREILP